MSKVSNVWVFSDAANRLEEVMGGAKELGEKVICFVMNAEDAKKHLRLELTRLWLLKRAS